MIRIGNVNKIKLVPFHNDMGNFTPSCYSGGTNYHYITDSMYMKFLIFTNPNLLKNNIEGSIFEIILGLKKEQLEYAINLNPRKSQIWEYNGLLNLESDNYVRNVVILGERNFKIITVKDIILGKIYKRISHLMNYTLYFKNKKEIKEWKNYLNKIHCNKGKN